MATVKSDIITGIESVPPVQPEPGVVRGKVRCTISKYTFASTASGDVVRMCKIPKGAKILPGGFLMTAALGASVTLSVGISGTATKYLAATTCNTANLKTALGDTIANICTALTAEEEIIVTVGGAAATGACTLVIPWVIE